MALNAGVLYGMLGDYKPKNTHYIGLGLYIYIQYIHIGISFYIGLIYRDFP